MFSAGNVLAARFQPSLRGHFWVGAVLCSEQLWGQPGNILVSNEKYTNIRVFLKGHFVKKKKCSPYHVTGGYLERSYPEGEADQTRLGGRH